MIYPWQHSQWQYLVLARQQEKLPHAILLTGAKGLGKNTFSKTLSQALLCEKQKEFACQNCRSCNLFLKENHPDYYALAPLEKSNVIKIDQIRELINYVHQTSHYGLTKVVSITPLDVMNRAAANALLKIVEEPVGNIKFILVSESLSQIPATILSRCQIIKFSRPNELLGLTWLKGKIKNETFAKQLFKISGGAPLQALKIADENYLSIRNTYLHYLISFLEKKVERFSMVTQWTQENLSFLLLAMFSITMDLLRLHLNIDPNYLDNQDQLPSLRHLLGYFNKIKLANYLQHLTQAQYYLANTNVNTQLLLENLLLDIS